MDNITINGREYSVSTHDDDCMGAPWEEHDGHGIVSDWTTRDKRSGELVLMSDRRSRRFYDVQETIKKASAEGWGLSNDQRAELAKKLGRNPTAREITAEAVQRDFEYLRGWCNDSWCWVYVRVDAPDGNYETLGGLQSNDEGYIAVCAHELAEQLENAYQDRQTEEATK